MEPLEQAERIIRTIEYLTIASVCPDGKPWNTPVYTAYDEQLNFYWASWVENQHSRNIEINPNVFLVMYDSRTPAGTGEGVYFQAQARSLKEQDAEEISSARHLLGLRAKNVKDDAEKFIEGNPRRIFKASPQMAWVNGDGKENGEFVDIRHSLNLDALIDKLKNEKKVI